MNIRLSAWYHHHWLFWIWLHYRTRHNYHIVYMILKFAAGNILLSVCNCILLAVFFIISTTLLLSRKLSFPTISTLRYASYLSHAHIKRYEKMKIKVWLVQRSQEFISLNFENSWLHLLLKIYSAQSIHTKTKGYAVRSSINSINSLHEWMSLMEILISYICKV